jgi:hypothetical protein
VNEPAFTPSLPPPASLVRYLVVSCSSISWLRYLSGPPVLYIKKSSDLFYQLRLFIFVDLVTSSSPT